jgi:phospholipase/carboxylesterase
MTTLIDGPRMEPAPGVAATSLVILLHGYGSNGEDLIGLAPHWRALLPTTAFVSPNAPAAISGGRCTAVAATARPAPTRPPRS